jgi:hypothetical protein
MRVAAVASALAAVACAWVLPRAPAQEVHKFPEHGFRITAPADWTRIPARPGELWILAQFMSDRESTHRDAATGAVSRHRPRLRVIGFPRRDSPVEITVVKETETRSVTSVAFPYRDYADYLKRHDHGGGYYVAVTEDVIVAGVPVTRQEIRIEKMAMVPRRLLACIYHLPDRDIAVEADVLETEAAQAADELSRALRSLVVTGEARKPDAATSRPTPPATDDPKELAKRRDGRRRAWRERVLVEVQKGLPKGWTSRKTKHFVVLSHASSKYTDLVVWQATEVREWLEDNFEDVGEGAVMRSVLRVCASADEARAYASGSGDSYVADSGEVVCAERDGSILEDFSQIARALLDQYLADRNPALRDALPTWLQAGLSGHVGAARISKKQMGLIFPLPVSELRACARIQAEGRLTPASLLMRTEPEATTADLKTWDAAGDFAAESELFVRYLLLGPGKSGRTKGLIQRTMAAAVRQLESRDLASWKALAETRPSITPLTEEEEEQEFVRRRLEGKEFMKKHREERLRLLEELVRSVLADWKADDWSRLDKSFEAWIRAGLKP